MPSLNANSITIKYHISGPAEGDWLVLINGLADDLTTWSAQLPAFHAAGYRVLCYDNRGVGGSSRPDGPYTASLLAADLRALLIALHIGPSFHLLGVSMGGMIAQAYALDFPNPPAKSGSSATANGHDDAPPRMASLSLCCTYAQPTTFCQRMFALWADMARRMSVADVMRDVMLWAFTVPFFRTRTDQLAEVEEAMRGIDMGLAEYLAQLNVIRAFDTTARLSELKASELVLGNLAPGQVLVLAGKVDILIPVVLSREVAESIEGARFVTCKGGHACMWEFPEDFNKTVLAFLNDQRAQ